MNERQESQEKTQAPCKVNSVLKFLMSILNLPTAENSLSQHGQSGKKSQGGGNYKLE